MHLSRMRNALRGVTWEKFLVDPVLEIDGVEYVGKMGYHLNQPTLAVVGDNKFIAMRRMPPETFRFEGPVLNTKLDVDVGNRVFHRDSPNGLYMWRLNSAWHEILRRAKLFNAPVIG